MDKINENIEKITENEEKIEMNQPVNVVEDKIETKGLKLKKSTKDRLNMLQSNFDDAESMIVTLVGVEQTLAVVMITQCLYHMHVISDEEYTRIKKEIARNHLFDELLNKLEA